MSTLPAIAAAAWPTTVANCCSFVATENVRKIIALISLFFPTNCCCWEALRLAPPDPASSCWAANRLAMSILEALCLSETDVMLHF